MDSPIQVRNPTARISISHTMNCAAKRLKMTTRPNPLGSAKWMPTILISRKTRLHVDQFEAHRPNETQDQRPRASCNVPRSQSVDGKPAEVSRRLARGSLDRMVRPCSLGSHVLITLAASLLFGGYEVE